jgi:hypothetical protein
VHQVQNKKKKKKEEEEKEKKKVFLVAFSFDSLSYNIFLLWVLVKKFSFDLLFL